MDIQTKITSNVLVLESIDFSDVFKFTNLPAITSLNKKSIH